MTIHYTNPFADPPSARDAVRAFRGRLASGVTLWTAVGERKPVGLTVSSLMVANGTPPRVLALVDPLADFTDALLVSRRAAVTILDNAQVRLAGVFAGTDPAPGGPFRQAEFTPTDWGPVPEAAGTWAGVGLESSMEVGWSLLVTCIVQHLATSESGEPLLHYRGGYPRLA
ncbi:flavin reductase family protein [Propionicimonas sp.]|uniref:flavin reductase family protein n=1 Tax=Propionicimonas sp. TaxID=1955623 RepID=UPI0039E65A20